MATLPTIIEIRKMNIEDLQSEIASIRREAAHVRLGVEMSKEKDTSKMKNLRRHMARLLTVLQEKSQTTQKSISSASSKVTKKSSKSLSKKTKASKIPAQS